MWTPGNKYCLPVQAAAGVIRASGSRILVLHIPNLKHQATLTDEALSFEELTEELNSSISEMVFFFNTSLCSTLEDVRQVIKLMNSICRTPPYSESTAFLKLEILDGDLRPDDPKTCGILQQIPPDSRGRCIPFLKGDSKTLRHISELGCPAARIWCSDIGKRSGITDESRLKHLLESTDIPLILEGGLATPQDVQKALGLGFSAVLMNSAFRYSPDPVKLAGDIRTAIDNMGRRQASC
jgi:thiazole synthase ThiGH ThiG subunit